VHLAADEAGETPRPNESPAERGSAGLLISKWWRRRGLQLTPNVRLAPVWGAFLVASSVIDREDQALVT